MKSEIRIVTKLLIVLLFLGSSSHAQQDTRKISVSLSKYKCRFRTDLKPNADSAFKIMTRVFNSDEFKSAIKLLNFPCYNYCKSCTTQTNISGYDVLNHIFNKKEDSLFLFIKKKGGALGRTKPFNVRTTAYYKNIMSDMCNLPFSAALAVNLCHEYMHHVGFCHLNNPKENEYRKPRNGNLCEDEKYSSSSYTPNQGCAQQFQLQPQ